MKSLKVATRFGLHNYKNTEDMTDDDFRRRILEADNPVSEFYIPPSSRLEDINLLKYSDEYNDFNWYDELDTTKSLLFQSACLWR
jgi:hypothetical protein